MFPLSSAIFRVPCGIFRGRFLFFSFLFTFYLFYFIFFFSTFVYTCLLVTPQHWELPRHLMPFVCVFWWCNAWEISFILCKQRDNSKLMTQTIKSLRSLLLTSLFTKHQAYLPCITNQNKEDKRHGMTGWRPVITFRWVIFMIFKWTLNQPSHLL